MRLVDSDRTDDDDDDDNDDEALAIARLPTAEALRCAATESIVESFDDSADLDGAPYSCLLPGLKHLRSESRIVTDPVSSSFWGSAL